MVKLDHLHELNLLCEALKKQRKLDISSTAMRKPVHALALKAKQ